MTEFSELVGQTLAHIENNTMADQIIFTTTTGTQYKMLHYQDCCENVSVEEIIGDLDDLVNDGPVLLAEEASEESTTSSESGTWTFYKLRTHNGDVTIRWLGESNGYYSESVYFERV